MSNFSGLGRIDTHHHFFPEEIPELAPQYEALSKSPEGLATGLARMRFPKSIDDHLHYMDCVGIRTAVVSPTIKLEWATDFSPGQYKELCERILQAQRQLISQYPTRFGAFAVLPLPHVQETLTFLQELSGTPPDGFGLTTSLGRIYFADDRFEPVWQALDAIGATLFIHPIETVMPPNLSWGPFVMEFTFDTCRCITTVLISGILTRYPNIKFLFAHNGGAFPFLAGRIGQQHIGSVIAEKNNGKTLHELLSSANIFFDTAVSADFQYDLVQKIGLPKDHIIYATDYPYTYRQDTKAYLDGYDAPRKSGIFTTQELDEGVVRENALKYLFPRLALEFDKLRN